MNYREKMKEYLKEPDEYSSQYGKWGILNREQRHLIKRLLKEMDSADEVIKQQYFEIERLNNIIDELEKELDLNLPFKVVGVRHLKNKLQELKGSDKE